MIAQHPMISFTDKDFEEINQNLNDPKVVSVVTANVSVKKVLINQESSTDLLYLLTLKRMGIPEEGLKLFHRNLVVFSGEQVCVKGYIDLLTMFEMAPLIKTISIQYLVIITRGHIMRSLAAHLSTL